MPKNTGAPRGFEFGLSYPSSRDREAPNGSSTTGPPSDGGASHTTTDGFGDTSRNRAESNAYLRRVMLGPEGSGRKLLRHILACFPGRCWGCSLVVCLQLLVGVRWQSWFQHVLCTRHAAMVVRGLL